MNDEGRPAVIEVLCDDCETALKFEDFDDDVRKDALLLQIGFAIGVAELPLGEVIGKA